MSAFHYIYYAIPVLRHEFILTSYAPSEIVRAGLTTALFLIAATVSWARFSGEGRASFALLLMKIVGARKELLIFLGLGLGIFLLRCFFSGLQIVLGPLFRFGSLRNADRHIDGVLYAWSRALKAGSRGTNWALAVGGIGIIVASAVATLFLIAGVIDCTAAVFWVRDHSKASPLEVSGRHHGRRHRVACRKIRNARKILVSKFRRRNFHPQVPGFLVEWGETGLTKLISGQKLQQCHRSRFAYSIALARATFVADRIPYLKGESYAQIPNMLVPRFINPEKQVSQYAMSLLNIRYGLQTQAETQKTSIGWGLLCRIVR